MRPNRLRLGAIAAWFGVVALALNALVPIHLAFDIAHALAPERHHEDAAVDHDFVRCLLSLVIGHHDDAEERAPSDKSHRHHHHADCAVCGAIGTLAGFAPAAVAVLAVPIQFDAATLVAIQIAGLPAAPLAAYRSRAPPLA